MKELEEAFQPAFETLEEAKANLVTAAKLFANFAEDAKPIIREMESNGSKIFFVTFERPLPARVRSSAMSCLVNSKHAFDQIVFAGELLLNRRKFKGYFPWVDRPEDIRPRLLKDGIHKAMHSPIIETCPYFHDKMEVPADAKRVLAAIANKKHKEGLVALPDLDGFDSGTLELNNVEAPGEMLYTGPDAVPGELARFKSGSISVSEDVKFTPYLCLDDPRLPRPAPAFDLINAFRAEAAYFLAQSKIAVEAALV